VVALATAACGGQQPYSSPVSTSAATTFDCVRGQLVQMGYSIDEADRDRGVVIGSRGLAEVGEAQTALVLEAEVDAVDVTSKLSIKPYRRSVSPDGDTDRDSDASAQADARQLLVRCGGRVDQGEPDRPYGVRPEITTTP
jgi:hypothetical protein